MSLTTLLFWSMASGLLLGVVDAISFSPIWRELLYGA